jgi:hypothetical protein
MKELVRNLAEAAAHLRQDGDYQRSWIDGRRGDASAYSESYNKSRQDAAAQRDRWADAIQKAIETLLDGREHNEMPERANG